MYLLRTLVVALWAWWAPVAWAAPLDLNAATLEDLDALPGLGPAKAQAILDWRAANGPFVKVEQLLAIPGVGPATYANVRALVRVGAGAPPEPRPPVAAVPSTDLVDLNTADAAALQTLPGISPARAQAILADRAANGPFPTCQDLIRVPGVGPATVANVAPRCRASSRQ